jgi:hypothetical protein
MERRDKAAEFRWCCIECGASIFGVLNEQNCEGRDDQVIIIIARSTTSQCILGQWSLMTR